MVTLVATFVAAYPSPLSIHCTARDDCRFAFGVDDPSAAADENSRLREAGKEVIKNLDDYRPTGAEAGAADAADAEVARQATLAAAAVKLQARHRGRLARKAYLKKLQQGFASKVKTASRFVRNLSMEADR